MEGSEARLRFGGGGGRKKTKALVTSGKSKAGHGKDRGVSRGGEIEKQKSRP